MLFILFDSASDAQGALAHMRTMEWQTRTGRSVTLEVEVAKRSLVPDER
jgi:hypothetical protein